MSETSEQPEQPMTPRERGNILRGGALVQLCASCPVIEPNQPAGWLAGWRVLSVR
ncbi:MAG: hypothetical protein ACYCST_19945 [Acidimicrobiales bacterium]